MDSIRGAWAEIDLDAIAKNIKTAKSKLKPGTKYCAVVKADGYGHGAVEVAKEAVRCGADFLAVAICREGVELREAGITLPILILGAMLPEAAETVVKNDLSHAVFDEERLRALNDAALKLKKKARIHIKVDTGMHRIGLRPEEAGKFAALAASLPGIEIEGAFSHFASADAENKDYAASQFKRFMEAVRLMEEAGVKIKIRHIANSATISELPEYQLDMVRQGISLYGMPPDPSLKNYGDFTPVMTVKAKISFVKDLPAGVTLGYGRTHTLKRPSRIATVPLGYADGISRTLSNKGHMIVRGKKAPIVGRICMDQLMLDVTDIKGAKAGDEIIVYGGSEHPIALVAEMEGTICHEVVCALGKRVPRRYVRNG